MRMLPIDVQAIPADFVDRVHARSVEEGDCWVWTGPKASSVPVVHVSRDVLRGSRARDAMVCVSVRRLLFACIHGADPYPRMLIAKCGHPQCVRPEHLQAQTAAAFSRRMSKHRNEPLRARKIAVAKRASAKLDAEKVRAIRARSESGPILAKEYGVDPSLISRIRRGQAWRDVQSPIAHMAQTLCGGGA